MKADWDDMDTWTQCLVLGYSHVREFEDAEEFGALARSRVM